MVSQTTLILHVDDDARVARVVATVLKEEGYRVVSASSAQEGLRKIHLENPDLVILDISMPGMSGLALLSQISSPDGTLRIPVLIFTAYAQMVDQDTRKRVSGFLTKPADGKTIVGEVRRILMENNANAPASSSSA